MDFERRSLDDEFWSEEETAAFCRVKRNTLRAWSSLRKGPPRIKVGRKALYRVASLKAWMEQHEIDPTRAK